MPGAQIQTLGVQSLVKELRSHMLGSETKKKKKSQSLITPESSLLPFAIKPPTESPTHPSAPAATEVLFVTVNVC